MTTDDMLAELAGLKVSCHRCLGTGFADRIPHAKREERRPCPESGYAGEVVQFPSLREECWDCENDIPMNRHSQCKGLRYIPVKSLEAVLMAGRSTDEETLVFSTAVSAGLGLDPVSVTTHATATLSLQLFLRRVEPRRIPMLEHEPPSPYGATYSSQGRLRRAGKEINSSSSSAFSCMYRVILSS